MPPIRAALLDLPPEAAARRLALAFLDEASAARERLQDPEDSEALHDCRVGMRRLRSCLRAYRPWLAGSVTKKLRVRLRDIAAATNPGRDAEVQLEWLMTQRAQLPARQRGGLHWLAERLETRKRDAYAHASAEVSNALRDLDAELRDRLSVYVTQVRLDRVQPPQRFAAVAGALVRQHAAELRDHLGAVRTAADDAVAHEARIRAKRLRYLLEPLGVEVEACKPVVKRIKALQDVLGELHDAQVLATEVASALEVAATEKARRLHELALQDDPEGARMRAELRRDERPGLLALAKRVRERRERLFAQLEAEWLGDRVDAFIHEIETLGDAIAARAPRDREIERKYLLRRLPDVVRDAPCREIEQGWLPGDRVQERLRRTRAGGAERHLRTVKLGQGLERIEIEEEISRELFEALWPLTAARRVRKRRWDVADGGRTWEIDGFLDRDLVLAEIELESADANVELPSWLAAHVIREVTTEPAYANVNLAQDAGAVASWTS